MRYVWLGGLIATERGPRLIGSLAFSVAIHCAALSFTGITAFRLLPPQEGSRSPRLTVDLLLNQPQAKPQAAFENTARSVVAPAVPSAPNAVVQHPESLHPDSAPGTVSNLPPSVEATQPPGLFPGPWYYAARYLHRRPTPLKPIRPAYPSEAENISGRVVLLLLLNEQGTVDSYQVIDSQPPGRFDSTVIEAFSHETYAPGLITGYVVKSQLLVEVVFEPGTLPEASILPDLTQFKIKAEQVPSATGN